MFALLVLAATAIAAMLAMRGLIGPTTAWFVTSLAIMVAGFAGIDRSVIRERLRRQESADPVRLLTIRMLILIHIVAGLVLAIRGNASPFPLSLRVAALFPYAAGLMTTWWAIGNNPFFVPVIRIQEDRGHRVMSGGPYRFVRHPGYSGLIVGLPFSGLALGSWISFAAATAASVLFVFRTRFEDAFLMKGLDGYRAYAERVRYRLAPGVW
jgi:protein-S-isoprenylcysteine O-methyltransferase Ste14